MKKVLLLCYSLSVIAALHPQIIHVPADYSTIQKAIDTANAGDTVLVSPGTYVECINFSGKNITVASLFLTTQDTSYVSQTIIDGSHQYAVVTFNDSSFTVLTGFTVTNGRRGISCGSYSSPLIKNVNICGNTGGGIGGGVLIGCLSNPTMENVIVQRNSIYYPHYYGTMSGFGKGGGIYCAEGSAPIFRNVVVKNNTADGDYGSMGGGIYFSYPCGAKLENVTICGNTAIGEGTGGGICYNINPGDVLEFDDLSPVFDSINRCNIYFNKAINGADLAYLSGDQVYKVILDTFTVMVPTDFHVSPLNGYFFDILNAKLEQAEADLYVSSVGDDNNTGLTADNPLKTIFRANSKILADTLHPQTIHLSEGTFSPSVTAEFFPVKLPGNISLVGTSENKSVIDAESTEGAIVVSDNSSHHISGLTITGGSGGDGGGICCINASVLLENLKITGNSAGRGGGISLYNSDLKLKNVCIAGNSAGIGGGICFQGLSPVFDSINRCSIYSNIATEGNDIFTYTYDPNEITVVTVDTFTVLHPTEFHATSNYPNHAYSFNILHGMFEQKNADLYISPYGNNLNSGLDEAHPLKTIHQAFSEILLDSTYQRTIHLEKGTYSNSATGELFPVNLPNYLNLEGISEEEVVLDAEGISSVIQLNHSNRLSGFKLTGGNSPYGGGIYCFGFNGKLENLIVTGNSAIHGGGIMCSYSNPTIKNVTISNNRNGGIHLSYSNPKLENVNIVNNSGNGLLCEENASPILKNLLISGNSGFNCTGIYCYNNSNPIIENVTITDNNAQNFGGGIYISEYSCNPVLINTIVWNNSPKEVFFSEFPPSSTITISYSDIHGGLESIETYGHHSVRWLEGNINNDPLFALSGDNPYTLTSETPCRNAGTPDTTGLFLPLTDLAGSPRIWDDRIDMGGYEWNNVGIDDFGFQNLDFEISIYPNPFMRSTYFTYFLEESSQVTLRIFDNYGRMAAEPVNAFQQKGDQKIIWNAENLPAGIYYCRLQAGERTVSKNIIKIQ